MHNCKQEHKPRMSNKDRSTIMPPRQTAQSTNADIGGQDGSSSAEACGNQPIAGRLLLGQEEVVGGPERGVRARKGEPDHDRADDVPPDVGEEHGDDGDPGEQGEDGAVVELGAEDPERLGALGGAREVEEEPGGAEREEREEGARVPEERGGDDGEDGERVVGAEVGRVAAHPGDGLADVGRLGEGGGAEDLPPGAARGDERLALLPEPRDELGRLGERGGRRRGVLDRGRGGGGSRGRDGAGAGVGGGGRRRVGGDLGVAGGGGGRRGVGAVHGGGRRGRGGGGAGVAH
uniref:Uncharacterized protein n=1 Tax=Triticum urartu TaxID=4572 RepID=A0A8R7QJL3_TRIUA